MKWIIRKDGVMICPICGEKIFKCSIDYCPKCGSEVMIMSKWIPVSERLPEESGRYLCTVGAAYRNPREMIYAPQEWADKCDNATWKSTDGSYVYDWFVEAWMPLPEPYKADGGEE